ncbi:MAG: tetratricopeptide repeat protein, partial [Cyanobacteria bacterium P01_C01_bin.72]
MNQRLINWQQGLDSTAIEEYNSLRRSLQRNRGFGLFFVQCSPAVGTNIVGEISKDVKQKKIVTLKFDRPINSLYNEIAPIPDIDKIDILFISGLEHSFLVYEEYNFGNGATHVDSSERYFRSKRGIPRFLGYLNLQRDRFKRDFPLSLVFLVPVFGIQYLIERTPDCFDWRSGFFRFMPEKDDVINLDLEHFFQKDKNQLRSELLDTKALTKELELSLEEHLQALSKQAALEFQCDRYEEAVASCDKYLEVNPNHDVFWFNRGLALRGLERYEEAIASFDQCLAINPNKDSSWFNRGNDLGRLERYEEAIDSYDKGLAINPEQDTAWFYRGNDLGRLERYEEAIDSY